MTRFRTRTPFNGDALLLEAVDRLTQLRALRTEAAKEVDRIDAEIASALGHVRSVAAGKSSQAETNGQSSAPPDGAKGISRRSRVVLVLGAVARPLTRDEVARALPGDDPQRIFYCLADLRAKAGIIDKPGRGLFALNAKGRAEYAALEGANTH